jgi:hypothetical protein
LYLLIYMVNKKITVNPRYILVYQGAVVILWLLDLQLPVQSVPITTKVVSLNPTHVEVYSIQYCVIKFVNDLRQVYGFLRILQFPTPIKQIATI